MHETVFSIIAEDYLFFLLGGGLIVATLTGFIARRLRQPLILAYLFSGFLLGPHGFNLIHDLEQIRLLSEMGITFLLFTVGLHMSLDNLTDLGLVSILTGGGQVVIMTGIGMLVSQWYGFSLLSSFYVGVAIAFSSTIIIVKLLSERAEINSLHGRISIGFLLVQDFLAILALVLLPNLGGSSLVANIGYTLLKIILYLIPIAVLTRYGLKPLFDSVAKNQELLFLTSISYCFLLATTSHLLGLSAESGAFIAGVTLTTLPYNLHIETKIRPLRDFLIVIFFLTLGAEMAFTVNAAILAPLFILSLLVLFGTPLILLTIMGLLGYRKRTSFMVGLTVAQISEFSLILINLGLKQNHIGDDVVSLVTGVGVITITISAYLITYGHRIYRWLEPYLSLFERSTLKDDDLDTMDMHDHVIVVGYHRVGYGIVNKLLDMDEDVLVVDFDPEIIKQAREQNIPSIYGDIADPDVVDKLNLEDAEMLISTSADTEDNIQLMRDAREHNKDLIVIIVAEHVEEALELYEEGADYVVLPHLLGGQHASLLLEDITTDLDKLIETKLEHIEELEERGDVHPHHSPM
jgi:Kef-type K+ transport system membrane component KefB/Trk K+ transport system NAD-binding subunit